MKITSILNFKVLGYAILAYAGISYALAQNGAIQGVNASWYNQLIMWIVAAMGSFFLDGKKVTLKTALTWILEKLKFLKPSDGEVMDNDILDDVNEIAAKLNKIGDTEGVTLCKQLNTHIFDKLYSNKLTVSVAEVKDASK